MLFSSLCLDCANKASLYCSLRQSVWSASAHTGAMIRGFNESLSRLEDDLNVNLIHCYEVSCISYVQYAR